MQDYAKLKPVLKAGTQPVTDRHVDEVMKKLVTQLGRGREVGTFNVAVIDGARRRTYCLELAGKKSSLTKNPTGASDFEVAASKETLGEIGRGELSPVAAFLTGRMEVHGRLSFGKRLFAQLAARGKLDIS